MSLMDDSSMSDAENHELVLSYLRRVLAAATTLSQAEGEDNDMMDASSDESPTYFIDQIASYLLKACRPDVLASGVGNLPNLASQEEKIPLEGEDEDEEEDNREYQHRRTDHLRQLLRVLAPLSLDVAAHVCSIVLSSTTSSDLGLPAFLLLSHWLPLAPHLTLMATEFFETLEFPWKESVYSSSQTEFLFVEACHNLCAFYMKRGEIATIQRLWDWNFVSASIEKKDVEMLESACMESSISSLLPTAIRWYGARIMGYLMDWKPSVIAIHLQRLELDNEQVPWIVHPWVLDQEEAAAQHLQLRGLTHLWKSGHFALPSSEQVRRDLPLHPWLVEVGRGIILYKHRALIQSMETDESDGAGLNEPQPIHTQRLIATSTTCRNLSLLGAALCQEPYPPPILMCGPHGSGKSSLVRELFHLCNPNSTLLEIHVDEETDSKTLIGSYTTTDIPGEFAWRAGALTNATREGQWVLLEDLDSVPSEIQAALVKLLEDRLVPLGNGKYERCHPSFRLFGTCTTASSTQRHLQNRDSLRIGSHRGGGKRILHPSLWRNVHVEPLPFSELKGIAASLYPNIPEIVADSSLSLLQALDSSGRAQTSQSETVDRDSTAEEDTPTEMAVASGSWAGGRNPSVRDFFKLLSRISNGVCFERNVTYATEAQRMLCLAESIDIFAGSCPDRARRQDFISKIAAPIWGITRDFALRYVETRRPTTLIGADFTEVGRAKIEVISQGEYSRVPSETFAQTNHALRLMESIGVCIRENEPVLLVGETGCGKTTLVQQLAGYCERELIVQNLSLQTDSTDLLGGYKPLELQHVARQVYREFVDLFVGTFSRKQNAQFLEYASSMREKSHWKKLSQCFQRAAKLGLSKVKEQSKSTDARKGRPTLKSWSQFEKTAERFERQRLACDAGLAFVFSEGALVEAIRSGKW
jgi:energy-coupling factor transporter ATP-binding protein EcfA2